MLKHQFVNKFHQTLILTKLDNPISLKGLMLAM